MKPVTKVKICPSCKMGDIELFIGGQTGNYKCNRCGYLGPIVVEIEKIRKKAKKKHKRR